MPAARAGSARGAPAPPPARHGPCGGESARATRRPPRRRRRGPRRARSRNESLSRLDRLLGLAEQEVEAAEVVRQLADVRLVGELLVRGTCALGVRAGEQPVALALGDERRLEVGGADRAAVVQRLGQLERALDVFARGLVVALAALAARAPQRMLERSWSDGRPERSARRATRSGARAPSHARKQVAADAEA